ncbi:MAG TPA: 6-hydroxymethylpterin diphosphokinase MptE-like protein [Stellaceae bacterium]|nr:6-hydroxymethylpterin diphosphokinase MptE-like protein [Stellaceae bacterium]
MTDPGFAGRSRAAFSQHFPELTAAIDGGQASPISVAVEGGVATDIVIGDTHIYGGNARGFAEGQVEAFMKKPLRLFMENPGAAGLVSEICVRMMTSVKTELAKRGITEIERRPAGNPTFLIIFGLGLGHHLMELARRTEARWLVIVEPSLDMIRHSFHALDWTALLERFDRDEGGVYLVTESDPAGMVRSIVSRVVQHGIPFIDGAWVFTHYPLWSFAEARSKLHDAIQYAFVNRGFFEDEITMMTNAVGNFTASPFWLLEGRPRLQRPETAVIVGAGPSLDESIATLHRIRDRVVLFSGGTSLRPLLRNGIVPDFHCELENVPVVVDVLKEASKYGDLSQIRLIASATVDPRVPPMFREAWYFFRDSVSSTMLLAGDLRVLTGAAPTCVNAAMAAATTLGFTEIALFGTDCGTRVGGADHASGTIYGAGNGIAKARDSFPIEVEGNFGGVARTDWVYDACRRMLGEVIRVFGLSPINTSDGALIPGARPVVPDAVEIETPPVDRQALVDDLKRALVAFAPSEILRERDFGAMVENTKDFYRELRERLGEFKSEDMDFAGVYRAVRTFLGEAHDKFREADSMCNGTLSALPRIAMFYGYRVEAGETRRAVFDTLMRKTGEIVDQMEKETLELFERLAKQAVRVPSETASAA